MPLLKLWNSFRGRSSQTQEPSPEQSPASQDRAQQAPCTADPAVTRKTGRSTGFNLFRGGPHAGLCKLLKNIPASSVLEISVEDGSRAMAVLETLAKKQENVRYLAIDEFEMSAGGVAVRQFHRTLRGKGFRPQLLPGSIDRGLTRVAYTMGAVDLVLMAAPISQWQSPPILSLLSRISHENTVVLYLDGETWKRFSSAPSSLRRAA